MTYADLATADLDRIRAEAMEIRCTRCHADPGQPCINTATKQPLARLPAHIERMEGVSI